MATENDDVEERREPFKEWASKYPPLARREIYCEGLYVFTVMVGGLLLPLVVNGWANDKNSNVAWYYFFSWVGGLIGGAVFSLKWLYHCEAKGKWNQDRRLWRLFSPWLSATLAFALFVLFESGLLNLEVKNPSKGFSLGFGFLAGYFSDQAAGKLREIAETLFGTKKAQPK